MRTPDVGRSPHSDVAFSVADETHYGVYSLPTVVFLVKHSSVNNKQREGIMLFPAYFFLVNTLIPLSQNPID